MLVKSSIKLDAINSNSLVAKLYPQDDQLLANDCSLDILKSAYRESDMTGSAISLIANEDR